MPRVETVLNPVENAKLTKLANDLGISKSETLRRASLLLDAIFRGKRYTDDTFEIEEHKNARCTKRHP